MTKDLGIINGRGLAAAVLITAPPHVALIKAPPFSEWKCPGGKMKKVDVAHWRGIARDLSKEETDLLSDFQLGSDVFCCALNCAIREVEEELHVELLPDDLVLLYLEERKNEWGDHWYFFFHARLSEIDELHERGFDPSKQGNGGEVSALFDQKKPSENVLTMVDFFNNQRHILQLPEVIEKVKMLKMLMVA